MICSSFWLTNDATTSDYQLNKIGVKTKIAGIQTGFHNHNMEFEKINGKHIYNALMESFDPEMVKMQFQIDTETFKTSADYIKKL